MLDKYTILPVSACVFALIVSPLLMFFSPTDLQAMHDGAARLENRIFWPATTAMSILFAVQGSSRLAKLTWPPHIICLIGYLSFAGTSVLWAYIPEVSFVRFVQEVMIIISIVLPALLAARAADIMRILFLCFGFASVLNFFFVLLDGSVSRVSDGTNLVVIGYNGYFEGKNYLGECAAIAFLLSLHELGYRGWRRTLGVIVVATSIALVFWSDCKTALGVIIICPFLARLALTVRKIARISLAVILLSVPFCCNILSMAFNISPMGRIGDILFNDSTLTGRTFIWDFVYYEIAQRPLLGWGYKSFWLVPDSPSINASGWVQGMPNAHNGYYDTMLELGYVGYAFLLVFIIATLHAIGRMADRDSARARLVLSLVLFVVIWNYFETLWMFGFDFLWVVFIIVAAEIGRYWQRDPVRRSVYRSGSPRPGSISPLLVGVRMPRPGIRPS